MYTNASNTTVAEQQQQDEGDNGGVGKEDEEEEEHITAIATQITNICSKEDPSAIKKKIRMMCLECHKPRRYQFKKCLYAPYALSLHRQKK